MVAVAPVAWQRPVPRAVLLIISSMLILYVLLLTFAFP